MNSETERLVDTMPKVKAEVGLGRTLSGFYTLSAVHVVIFSLTLWTLLHTKDQFSEKENTALFEYVATGRFVSSQTLAYLRLLPALTVLLSCGYILLEREGLLLTIVNRDGVITPVLLKHWSRFTTFTVLCWTLQGVYFSLSSYLSFAHANSYPISPILVKISAALFEICFATAYLVTTVVSFVLIPASLAQATASKTSFFDFFPVLFHNGNVAFMAFELCMNRIPFNFAHFPFIVLYGQLYVLFSWTLFRRIGVFYYFFLDYEAKYAVIWQLGLLAALTLFFFLGSYLSSLLNSGQLSHTLFIMVRHFKAFLFLMTLMSYF